MKLRTSDITFSRYIRERDRWTCCRCKRQYEPPTAALQCSHFFGRTMWSVRFDPDNCIALCHGCHRYWEKEDREGYREYMLKRLGQFQFDRLTLKARMKVKRDEKLAQLYARELLNKLLADQGQATFGRKA